MKKSLIVIMAMLLVLAVVFAACSSKTEDEDSAAETSASDLNDVDTEYGFETEAVTDENGEEVTDKDGNVVTTDVAVVYKTDDNGKTYAQKLDADGNAVTNSEGKAVTVKTTYSKSENTTADNDKNADSNNNAVSTDSGNNSASTAASGSNTRTTANTIAAATTANEKTTATTKKNVELTKDSSTTKFNGKEEVPKTSATGEEVNFSEDDQEIIASMLEVPYLYRSNYENSDGIPVDTAVYTAVWMAQREGATTSGDDYTYSSNPIILNLFKYYGNTVVNFKTKCNSVDDTPIVYSSSKDSFAIKSFPEKQQSVTITKIEDLGNNNFYKITGSVTNAGKIKTVVAVVQKNRLEPTLGFSIKALKWS